MGEKLFFFLWTSAFSLSLHPSSLLLAPQGIQCHFHFVYSLPEPPDASGHARTREKAAHAGQRRALEHATVLPTVDTALPSTSGRPRAPVDVPRRPHHASRSPTCSCALLSPLRRVPERHPHPPIAARVPGPPRARSSLPLSFPGRRPHPGRPPT